MRRSAPFLAGALLAVLPAPALAADNAGVYGWITKVVYEPDGMNVNTAVKARIYGWFALASSPPGMGDTYTMPAAGYLYYNCPNGKEAACRAEWGLVAAQAGTGHCITFGSRALYPNPGNGKLWPELQISFISDPYPLSGAVLNDAGQCPAIKAAIAKAPDLLPPVMDLAIPLDMTILFDFAGADLAEPPPPGSDLAGPKRDLSMHGQAGDDVPLAGQDMAVPADDDAGSSAPPPKGGGCALGSAPRRPAVAGGAAWLVIAALARRRRPRG